MKRVGYWISERKSRKLFDGFEELCRNEGIEAVRIDLDKSLESQGRFDLFVHKLNDELAKADQRDPVAMKHVNEFQNYCARHPHIPVLDPLSSLRKLLDRNEQYQFVKECYRSQSGHNNWFIPDFVELSDCDAEKCRQLLMQNNVKYPLVAKPSIAQGVSTCHQMSLVFNDEGVKDLQLPCVAQSFVNHNAVMYKIFVIGSRHYIVERPSIKNLHATDIQSTIFFDSHDVSKPDSASFLNKYEPSELELPLHEPNEEQMEQLAVHIQQRLGLTLFGIDVIIENGTGRYAVIDINSFPGYDGVPNFIRSLSVLIKDEIQAAEERMKIPVILNGLCSDVACLECANYSSDEGVIVNGHMSSGDEPLEDFALRHKKKKKIQMHHITFCGGNGITAEDGITKSMAEFDVDGDVMRMMTCQKAGGEIIIKGDNNALSDTVHIVNRGDVGSVTGSLGSC